MSTEGGVDMHRGRRRYEGGGDMLVSSLKRLPCEAVMPSRRLRVWYWLI